MQIVENEQHGRVFPYDLDQGLQRVDLRVRPVGTLEGPLGQDLTERGKRSRIGDALERVAHGLRERDIR